MYRPSTRTHWSSARPPDDCRSNSLETTQDDPGLSTEIVWRDRRKVGLFSPKLLMTVDDVPRPRVYEHQDASDDYISDFKHHRGPAHAPRMERTLHCSASSIALDAVTGGKNRAQGLIFRSLLASRTTGSGSLMRTPSLCCPPNRLRLGAIRASVDFISPLRVSGWGSALPSSFVVKIVSSCGGTSAGRTTTNGGDWRGLQSRRG